MERRIKLLIISIITLLITFGIFSWNKIHISFNSENVKTANGEIQNKCESSDIDVAFSVLGDVHEDIEGLQQAIDDLHEINPKQDLLVLNGDNVGQGLQSQYISMKNALDKNKDKLPSTIIKNIGNHEFFDYNKETNNANDVREFIDRYLQFSGESKVYHHKWIKNYHFISLGSEDGNTKALGSVKAYLSPEQLTWFKEKLNENYKPGKPIFVFLHQHIDDSIKGWVGSDQRNTVKEILSKYPEVILFTSHTHLPLEKYNVTINQPYTMVQTGAVRYTLLIDNKGNVSRVPYNEGLYIEVRGSLVIRILF